MSTPTASPDAPGTEDELEERLSRPSAADVAFASHADGRRRVLGAGGKMGPSLARRVRRSLDAASSLAARAGGRPLLGAGHGRGARAARGRARERATSSTRRRWRSLPRVPNVLFLAGRKFGSADRPDLTWAQNVIVPVDRGAALRRQPDRGVLERERLPARPPRQHRARPRGTRSHPWGNTRRPASAASASSSTPRASAARRASCSGSSTPSTCATARSWTWRARSTPASRWTCASATSTPSGRATRTPMLSARSRSARARPGRWS